MPVAIGSVMMRFVDSDESRGRDDSSSRRMVAMIRWSWTFEQTEHRKLGAMIERAGNLGIAADLDLGKIAALLPALKKRAFEMYAEGERLTGHEGLPLGFTRNLAVEKPLPGR